MTYDPMAGAADMVERVAIAISLADDDGLRAETIASYYRALARAAIAAMREPTDAMVREGGPYATSLHCWRAMIDAALQPTERK